ncbi:hypothetical protein WV31_08390 [Magnetospirillum sp. ME-1]|nr:hypothetical protein WV31_08390 [Magnetospirillum sp. ME-1]
MIANRFGLPGLLEGPTSITLDPDGTRLEITEAHLVAVDADRLCPHGCPGRMASKQPVMVEIQDVPLGLAHRRIHLAYPVLRCGTCKTTRRLRPDWLDVTRPMTTRLVAMIEHESHRASTVEVARRTGVDERVIGQIFDEAAWRWQPVAPPLAPRRLGIDEAHIGRVWRGVVVDLDSGALIDILEGRGKEHFRAFFDGLEGADAVEVVAIDMTRAYEEVARECFPGAMVVVDRWHVTQKAREALNTVREGVRKRVGRSAAARLNAGRALLHKRAYELALAERESLNGLCRRHPDLGLAYDLKEGLFEVYDQKDPVRAEAWLDKWLACVDAVAEQAPQFAPVAAMIRNWHGPILAYWRTGRTTNAMTENANGRLKRIHREGRTLDFRRFRAKALYRMGARPRVGILASEILWAWATLRNQGWTTERIVDHLTVGHSPPQP